jgi:hypothetical protein
MGKLIAMESVRAQATQNKRKFGCNSLCMVDTDIVLVRHAREMADAWMNQGTSTRTLATIYQKPRETVEAVVRMMARRRAA